jgi:predicted ATPase
MTFEVFDRETLKFCPIVFNRKEDIHSFLGSPLLKIITGVEKENHSYYSMRFDKEFLLSIEHGLSFLCHKDEIIDIESTDTETIIQSISFFEMACSLWQKNFWKIKYKLASDLYRNRELAREMWLEK